MTLPPFQPCVSIQCGADFPVRRLFAGRKAGLGCGGDFRPERLLPTRKTDLGKCLRNLSRHTIETGLIGHAMFVAILRDANQMWRPPNQGFRPACRLFLLCRSFSTTQRSSTLVLNGGFRALYLQEHSHIHLSQRRFHHERRRLPLIATSPSRQSRQQVTVPLPDRQDQSGSEFRKHPIWHSRPADARGICDYTAAP